MSDLYEDAEGTDMYLFLDSFSEIDDTSCNEEEDDGTSLFNGDSIMSNSCKKNARLFSLSCNGADENENIVKSTVSPSLKLGEPRRKRKHLRSVGLMAENSKNYIAESSIGTGQVYGMQLNGSSDAIEQEQDSVRPCGCHKSRVAKCFKELETESLENGNEKKSLFYRDINEWCKNYEVNKTREICVPLIHQFYLNKSDSDNLF
ncbi:hypothetical protein SEUBUCD646_0G04070 [Saccharomyces eubayanus]|uniref:Uncharacterized protein n=2 Tax=Saccharomyces TaxID=4930 RepID=A0A6C1E8G0_SACPS|nr:hypothetical protein GRS66_007774 [Saccharomyces pastorianus]CAI2009649.1 hypothetical protein SEUBUCD650_0G04060 [Saccharomyces eubayanus]CAI2026592.1 hypothetical protein SEUBUCD646_0G04070 [Saccharomyces eubayanus]